MAKSKKAQPMGEKKSQKNAQEGEVVKTTKTEVEAKTSNPTVIILIVVFVIVVLCGLCAFCGSLPFLFA